jgi:hypothetical protein
LLLHGWLPRAKTIYRKRNLHQLAEDIRGFDYDVAPLGRRTVNTEPLPGSLTTITSPPIMRANSVKLSRSGWGSFLRCRRPFVCVGQSGEYSDRRGHVASTVLIGAVGE